MAAVLLSSQTDVAGPCAFDIRLGINTGSRSSPECDLQTVGVTSYLHLHFRAVFILTSLLRSMRTPQLTGFSDREPMFLTTFMVEI